jgi:hypothetical protein
MPAEYGETQTALFVTALLPVKQEVIDQAFADFFHGGWTDLSDTTTGFHCLLKSNADIAMVRQAAKNNPGLVYLCFTQSFETNLTTVNVGFGGAWLSKTCRISKAVGPLCSEAPDSYCGPINKQAAWRRPQLPKSADQIARRTGCRKKVAPRPCARTAHARIAPKQVNNRLVFHGLPAEVERCRELAVSAIPAEARPRLKYTTNGGESYVVGSMEVTTADKPAFGAFNRLVAQVPAVTVTLEYQHPKSATWRLLRAVDGKIIQHVEVR